MIVVKLIGEAHNSETHEQTYLYTASIWPKSVYIRVYPETDDICPSVEAYVRLSHGHRPLPHLRETHVEEEAGDLIPSLPFAEAGFGEEDARGTRIVLP